MKSSALIFLRASTLQNTFAYIESLHPDWQFKPISTETNFAGRLYARQKEVVPPFTNLLKTVLNQSTVVIDVITYGFWVLQFSTTETLLVAFHDFAIQLAEADDTYNDPLLYLQTAEADQVSIDQLVHTALTEFKLNYQNFYEPAHP